MHAHLTLQVHDFFRIECEGLWSLTHLKGLALMQTPMHYFYRSKDGQLNKLSNNL